MLQCSQEGKRSLVNGVAFLSKKQRSRMQKDTFFSQQILTNHDYFLKELFGICGGVGGVGGVGLNVICIPSSMQHLRACKG